MKTVEYYSLDLETMIFQHENDPKHTAESVQEWMKDNGIRVLKWPSKLPDLNPIEHLWAHLKKQLIKYDRPASGMIELWESVQREWDAIKSCV